MESHNTDSRLLAAATLRRAIEELFPLGYTDITKTLEGLLARISERTDVAAISVNVCSGRVLADGFAVPLTNRELEICFALAVHQRPVPGDTLGELMFPDLDANAAANRIKVYVHRVREKIAADFIICDRDGYRFRDGIRIDLEEFRGLIHLLERCAFLSEGDRQSLHTALARVRGRRNAPVWRWDWFAAIERTIEDIASRATALLAADASERNATAELLDLARFVLASDPCDEQAREIAIKAYLATGDLTKAMSEFKHYEAYLARDLQAEPSPRLRKLLNTA